jgi:predicted fused transcriptional regulator/phosphomethylpyrimidine kinase
MASKFRSKVLLAVMRNTTRSQAAKNAAYRERQHTRFLAAQRRTPSTTQPGVSRVARPSTGE